DHAAAVGLGPWRVGSQLVLAVASRSFRRLCLLLRPDARRVGLRAGDLGVDLVAPRAPRRELRVERGGFGLILVEAFDDLVEGGGGDAGVAGELAVDRGGED